MANASRHMWIITGPAGCGKSTVARHLAQTLSLTFIEGDELHPPANISKMASGVPLTDADRWDWLILLRSHAVEQLTLHPAGVVVTCSALKRKYRDVIRVANYYNGRIKLHFVYLRADPRLLLDRVKKRQGHFMKEDMVRSQFDTLEEPETDETDVLFVDVSGQLPEVQAIALRAVKEALADAIGEAFSPSHAFYP